MIQAPLTNYGYAPVVPQYVQQPQPEYNAIKINIIDPKVNAPGTQSQAPVYSYPQAPVYNYPQAQQAPVYTYPQMPAQVYYPPVQQQGQAVIQTAPAQAPVQPVAVQQPVQPAQTVPVQPQPQVSTPAPQVINTQTVNQVPPSVVPEAPVQQQPMATVDVPAFTAAIKSDDLQKACDTIEKVADLAQNDPQVAPQLLDTDLMEALLSVIGKDTSNLEGPTEKQRELRQQDLSGKQLSEADLAEANRISPSEMADRNKQYALFTTAILQDLLVKEFQKTNNITPDIKDIPGMEQIVTTIKDNPNPMLRASGLAALAYNARPEYKPVMKEIFELSKQDADENVQKVAAEGLAKLEKI